MKRFIFTFLALFLVLYASLTINAHATGIPDASPDSTSGSGCAGRTAALALPPRSKPRLSLEEIEKRRALAPPKIRFRATHEAVGPRGFLGRLPEFSLESFLAAGQRQIFEWDHRVFIEPSPEAAKAHHDSVRNQLLRGSYIIAPKPSASFDSPASFEDSQRDWRRLFSEKAAEGMIYFDESGTAVVMAPQFVRENFVPTEMKLAQTLTAGTFLKQKGWFFPPQRGVLHYFSAVNSTTYDNIKAHAWKLLKEGYQIKFNSDIDRVLSMLRDQERQGQSASQNRYASEQLRELIRGAFHRGHIITTEVWSAEGQLMGGILSLKFGNVLSPDTVFYADDINYAKVAAVVFLERAMKAGIFIFDTQFVSTFTESLGGELVSSTLFRILFESLPRDPVSLDFSPLQLDESLTGVHLSPKQSEALRPAELKRPVVSSEVLAFKLLVDSRMKNP
jgi:Leu/Phe-tRNA-protein transferase